MHQIPCDDKIIRCRINCEKYKPLIKGDIAKLVKRLEVLKRDYPLTADLLLRILQARRKHQFLLEDWLTILPYQFAWDKKSELLAYLEKLFNELFSVAPEAWNKWVSEVERQTGGGILSTHAICDRIYDYLVHLYAALWLIRQGCSSIEFPDQQNGNGDVIANCGSVQYIVECKCSHTSEKLRSYCARVINAFNPFFKLPFLPSDTPFSFSSSKDIKTLSYDHCKIIKKFVRLAAKKPRRKRYFKTKGLYLWYNNELPLFERIDFQQQRATNDATYFEQYNLSRILDHAAEQLNRAQDTDHKKILFIGIQPDRQFSPPWNDPILHEMKLLLALNANKKYGIQVIFSEDVGFSIAGYL